MDFLGFPVDRTVLEGMQAFFTVVMIDLVLAGDNAVVIGLAAAGLPAHQRGKAILIGVIAATVLRILFALVATQLLMVVGLLFAGGVLLLWVCWKMWRELRQPHVDDEEAITGKDLDGDGMIAGKPISKNKSLSAAVTQIVIADVSMSLDNVLAVAGAAKGSAAVLAIGLLVAIVLMAIAANYIAGLLGRYPWITWIGLLIIVWVALDMIFDGSREVACATWKGVWCAPDLPSLIRGLTH